MLEHTVHGTHLVQVALQYLAHLLLLLLLHLLQPHVGGDEYHTLLPLEQFKLLSVRLMRIYLGQHNAGTTSDHATGVRKYSSHLRYCHCGKLPDPKVPEYFNKHKLIPRRSSASTQSQPTSTHANQFIQSLTLNNNDSNDNQDIDS